MRHHVVVSKFSCLMNVASASLQRRSDHLRHVLRSTEDVVGRDVQNPPAEAYELVPSVQIVLPARTAGMPPIPVGFDGDPLLRISEINHCHQSAAAFHLVLADGPRELRTIDQPKEPGLEQALGCPTTGPTCNDQPTDRGESRPTSELCRSPLDAPEGRKSTAKGIVEGFLDRFLRRDGCEVEQGPGRASGRDGVHHGHVDRGEFRDLVHDHTLLSDASPSLDADLKRSGRESLEVPQPGRTDVRCGDHTARTEAGGEQALAP